MITITTSSFKGGTGKTSITQHLACALGLFHNKKCLLIDSDPQANLSSSMGFSLDELDALPAVLQEEKEISDVIRKTCVENVDIILANTYLDQIESTAPLVSDSYSHERLRDSINKIKGEYDFCFIDIPPSLNWLCRSAFYASNYSIIAAVPEPFSVLAMDRLSKYHETINKHHSIEVLGVVLSLWDDRGAINEAVSEGIELSFPGKIFDTKVRKDRSIPRSVIEGNPVFLTDHKSRAGEDYKNLVNEINVKINTLIQEKEDRYVKVK